MTANFFLVALPGLEDVVARELREWYPDLEPTVEHGGVAVSCDFARGLSFNQTLKTPTRALVRLASARCRDFPKLYKFILGLPWDRYVDRRCRMVVGAATRASRLKIKARIESTARDAWAKLAPGADGPEFNVLIRVIDDECTVSLDTSGERLHKRGVRTRVGEAPLRETIAAALIRMVYAEAGPTTAVEIFDPMAGSGTFLLEAATMFDVLDRRAFAPLRIDPLPVSAPGGFRPARLIGFERDADTLIAARANLRDVAGVELLGQDVFDAEPLAPAANRRWLFVNPPYGERLRVDEPLPMYYARLFAATERVARPDFVAALLPAAGAKGRLALPGGWRVVAKRPFSNGGIPVVAFVFRCAR